MKQKDNRLLIVSGVSSDAWLASLLSTCISELATRALSEPEFRDFDTIGLWTFNRRITAKDLEALARIFKDGLYQNVFVTGFFHADETRLGFLPSSVHPARHPCLRDNDIISLARSLWRAELNSSWLSINEKVNHIVATYGIDTFSLDEEKSFAELLFASYVNEFDIDSLQPVWDALIEWFEIEDYLYDEDTDEESEAWEFLEDPFDQIDTKLSSSEFIKHFKNVYKCLRELLDLPSHNPRYITEFSQYYDA